MSPQEIRYAKIGVAIGVIGLILTFLNWVHPFAPGSKVSGTGETTTSSETSVQPPGPQPGKPPVEDVVVDLPREGEGGLRPHTRPLNPATPTRACDMPETASLRPGVPAQMASGLAVLSVKTAQEGSEPYLTLGIASDRDTLTRAVLGAPVSYHFATSRGAYFVNVTDIDLKDGVMTVQVGCEAKESKP